MSGALSATITRGTFEMVARLLRARAGIVLTQNKLYLIESRLQPVLRRHGVEDLAEMAGLLGRGAKADAITADIVEAMTTNETFFFRDEKPFVHLRTVALPALHAARPPGQPLRIWSAASSSGQEAYSIGMVIDEMEELGDRPVELIATDLSRRQVERAKAGLYSHFEIQRGLPARMLASHFDRQDRSWRIRKHLRERVSFREWNLLDDPVRLGRFDIVFCRNVLLYFDQTTKREVLDRIAGRMPNDGVLYLGGAETVVGLRTPFAACPGEIAFRLYRPEMIRSTS